MFLGRVNAEKAPDLGIRVAREAGCRIVLAERHPLPIASPPQLALIDRLTA